MQNFCNNIETNASAEPFESENYQSVDISPGNNYKIGSSSQGK